MLKTLRIRFIALSMALFAVMLSIIFGLIYYFTAADLRDQSIRYLESISDSRGKITNRLGPKDELRTPCFTIQMPNWGGAYVVGSSYYDLADDALVEELMTQALDSEESIGVIKGYSLRFLRRSSFLGWTVAFADITAEKQMLLGLLKDFVVIGLISLLLFFAVSLLLSRWVIRPVKNAWDQQNQFVADASHELKTPLAVIMANAELLADTGYTEEERSRFGANIITMSHKMRELVERMLDLTRADNGQLKKTFEPLDLSTLVSDSALVFEPLFFESSLELSYEIEPDISVSGSAFHLRQAVEILLDNAQKYSLPGQVRLSLRRSGRGRCLLCLSNPAEDMSADELKSIFKRFYRADKARTGQSSGSYGLGLAIAESITAEHGGKIWADSREGRLSFFIQLPTL